MSSFYIVGFCLFSLYIYIFPGWFDTAELTSSAFNLGISHPPGEPLYNQLAHLFTLLPFGSIAFRTSLFSAFCASCFSVSVFATYKELSKTLPTLEKNYHSALGLLILLHPLVILQSTRTELYTLLALLISLSVYFYLRFTSTKDWRFLALSFLLSSLQMFVHPLFGLCWFLAFLATCTHKRHQKVAPLFIFIFLGSGILLYLPIRSFVDAFPNWGNPDQWSHLLNVLSSKDYQQNLQLEKGIGYFRLKPFILSLGVPLILLSCMGLFHYFKRTKEHLVFYILLTLFFILPWCLYPFVPSNPDIQGYLLPLFALFCPFQLLGIHYLLSSFPAFEKKEALLSNWALLIFIIFVTATSSKNTWKLHGGKSLENLSHTLDQLPSFQTAMVTSDHWLFSMWYRQSIEGRRPDIRVISKGLLPAKWYRSQLSLEKNQKLHWQESLDDKDTFAVGLLSHSRFKKIHQQHLKLCKERRQHDYFSIETSICSQIIAQWTHQWIKQKHIKRAQHFLEVMRDKRSEPCQELKDVQLPFPLIEEQKHMFLPHPSQLDKQLMFFYAACGDIKAASSAYRSKIRNFNAHLLQSYLIARIETPESGIAFLNQLHPKSNNEQAFTNLAKASFYKILMDTKNALHELNKAEQILGKENLHVQNFKTWITKP